MTQVVENQPLHAPPARVRYDARDLTVISGAAAAAAVAALAARYAEIGRAHV